MREFTIALCGVGAVLTIIGFLMTQDMSLSFLLMIAGLLGFFSAVVFEVSVDGIF